MSVTLTGGHAGDNPQLFPLLDQISVQREGPGRPRTRPDGVLADKAYSHPSTRKEMRTRGIPFTSPEKSDQVSRRKAKGSDGGRPPVVDYDAYKHRNVVERCFNRLKQFRDLSTRYTLMRHSAGSDIPCLIKSKTRIMIHFAIGSLILLRHKVGHGEDRNTARRMRSPHR